MKFSSRLALALLAPLFTGAVLSPLHAQTLAADYQLQDVFTSSVGTIGPLNPTGNFSFVSGSPDGNTQRVLRLTTTTSPAMPPDPPMLSGVQAQTAGAISASNYSIVLLANFLIPAMQSASTKIFDFKNLSSDAGLYVNSATGILTFVDGSGMGTPLGTGPALNLSDYAQVVLTRDGITNLVSVYLNGAAAFTFTDTMGFAVLGDTTASSPNAFLTLFRDDATTLGGTLSGETTQGNIARLRLYDGVLDETTVAGLDRVIPEPSTWALLGAGAVLLGARQRRRKA